jgi:hypothetical protein
MSTDNSIHEFSFDHSTGGRGADPEISGNPGLMFDVKGQPTTNEELSMAKYLERSEGAYYFVKVGTVASTNHRDKVANPYDMFYNPGDFTQRPNGEPCFAYRKVEKTIFDTYLQFLRTGRPDLVRIVQAYVKSL